MRGAIIGDVAGSHYEHFPDKSLDIDFFREHSCFTDDTVLSVAVADWVLNGGKLYKYFHDYVERYPTAGYGGTFINWARGGDTQPYNSWGNGSAMRVSPVAFARDTIGDVMDLASQSAVVTHNHPDGIAGAQATAGAIFLARTGGTKADIATFVQEEFGYNVNREISEIRPTYSFDVSCAGSVPESIIAFLESDSFESAIRIAISLGGDSDTMACIAGSIAEPFYGGVPENLWARASSYLDDHLLKKVQEFRDQFGC
jgi:ADP-ribosylglycohydrolase